MRRRSQYRPTRLLLFLFLLPAASAALCAPALGRPAGVSYEPAADWTLDTAIVYAVHKPRGVLSAVRDSRPDARLLTELMVRAGVEPLPGHVGRLDKDTSGLLLVTSDSLLNRAIVGHPDVLAAYGAAPTTKRYRLLLAGAHAADGAALSSLASPMSITRGGTKACDGAAVLRSECFRDDDLAVEFDMLGRDDAAAVEAGRAALRARRAACRSRATGAPRGAHVPEGGWLTRVTLELRQGRHHQIRRLCRRARLKLRHLERVAVGPVELGALPAGGVRVLGLAERRELYAACLPALVSDSAQARATTG